MLALTVMVAACETVEPDHTTWGSPEASVRITGDQATIQLMAAGGCYGSYGNIDEALPSGSFALSGSYTQLMGVYPGSIQYPAQYAGTIAGNTMTLSISVPALQQTLGPFHLAAGVTSSWSPCLYP
jgi:hypothetical protein